jgi:Dolichyl-phosphate-mannose-protein mannosyltransferase
VASGREAHGRRPAQVAVAAEDQDPHGGAEYPGAPMTAATEVLTTRARSRFRELGRPVHLALAAILLIAFAVRLWAALNPIHDPGPDAEAYASIARWLFEEHRYGSPTMQAPSDWSPGAPLLYAGLYFLIGSANSEAARILVAVIGTAMVLCVFLLGLRLAGRAVGLLAALLAATYPTFIENNAQLLSEPLAAFLLSAGLLAFLWAGDRRQVAAWLLPGALFGALILTRPEYQAVTLILAAFAGWRVWRDRSLRLAFASAAVVLAAAALVVAPWTIRNVIVLDRLVPVSTGGQKALFVATYLPGDGRQVPTKRELMRRLLGAQDPITTDELRRQRMEDLLDRVARKYPDMPRDEALGRIGRENFRKYVSEQPLDYAWMSVRKLWNMWERGSSPYMRDWGWNVYHKLLLLLGIGGFVLLVRRAATRYDALLLAVPIAAISVLGTVLLAVPRRQVPLMPLICVFAGAALVWAFNAVITRRSAPPR